ncbi:MAG: hypothetical protein ABWJ97_00120 [Thermoproteus sp.]
MSLLGLIVKSRFTNAYVFLLAVSTIYLIVQAALVPKLDFAPLAHLSVSLTAVIAALAALGGGPLILRADLDFLLQIPLNRLALAMSLYFAQLLLYWPFFLYVVSMSLMVPYLGLAKAVLVSLLSTSLAVSVAVLFYKFSFRSRALAAALLGLWLVSPIFGFAYSPTAALLGSDVGLAVSAIAAAASAVLAVRSLRSPEAYVVGREGGELSGGEVSFRGAGAVKAIYLMRLYNISTVGRGAWGGVQFRSGRLGMGRAVLAASAASSIYLAAVLTYRNPLPSVIAVFVASAASASLMGTSSVANERLWISASALGVKYFKHAFWGIAAATLVFLSPLSVAGIAAWLLGVPSALGVAIASLGQIPPFAAIYAYLFALISPYQVRGEHTWPLRIGLKTFLLSLSAFASFVAGALAVASPVLGLYASALFYLLLFVATRRGPLEKALESLVLNGFI